MKHTATFATLTVCLLISAVVSTPLLARQDPIAADSADVSTMDNIIAALYDVISGPEGTRRNWDRMRSLFLDGGRLMGTARLHDGTFVRNTMTVDEYIARNAALLEEKGFFEQEIGRHTDSFGNIVQVFSAYEARMSLADEKPFLRGINSIQLWNDGARWWIVSVFWQSENPEQPIPERYLRRE